MAQAVTQAFIDEWSKKGGKVAVSRVRYKRRFFNGTIFVYETNFHTLNQNQYSTIGNITVQIDSRFKNIFKTTEITIRLVNTQNEWIKTPNDPSIFAGDTEFPGGYDDFLMQVEIDFGYIVGGTPVFLQMFTGLATLPHFDGLKGTASITVSSAGYKLTAADASKVNAGIFTDEETVPRLGDGSNIDFVTTSLGVSHTTQVSIVEGFNVTSSNRSIDFKEGGVAKGPAQLTVATYESGLTDADAGTLCAEIKLQLEASGVGTYDVIFIRATRKFTITRTDGGGTFDLPWNTGPTSGTSAKALLGYEDVDDTGSLNYTSDNATPGGIKIQVEDYSVSDVDQTSGAKITFVVTPPDKTNIFVSGLKWHLNKTLDFLLPLLYDEAGILSGQREISPVIFPGGLSGSKTVDSQADWENGTVLTFIDTTKIPGSIKSAIQVIDDFSDGDFSSNPAWTIESGAWKIATGRLRSDSQFPGTINRISTPFTETQGFWEFTHEYTNKAVTNSIPDTISGGNGGASMRFMVDGGGDYYELHGAADSAGANPSHTFILRKVLSGTPTSLLIFSFGGGVYSSNVDRVWKITRTAAGVMEVFLDGVSKGTTAADLAVTSSVKIVLLGDSFIGAFPGSSGFDNISWSPDQTAVYESEEFDLLAAPTAWGVLDITEILNGGTTAFKTKVASISGGPFDAAVAIDPGTNQILSAEKQFFIFTVDIDPSAVGFDSPVIGKVVANFSTNVVNLAIAIHRGSTVKQKIDQYARLVDYETGFSPDGTAYFRSKDVAAVFTIAVNQENVISRLVGFNPGYADVENAGEVRYNDFTATFDAIDAGEPSPTSEQRFGRIVGFEDLSSILLANDVNLAESRARLIYENSFIPKKRCRLICKIIPWLEVSDIIRVTYFDHPLLRGAVWGDPLAPWGKPWASYAPASNVLANALDFKIVGIVWKLDKCMMELTLEENL